MLDSINGRNRIEALQETLNSFGIDNIKKLDKKYIRWFSELEYFYEIQDFIFVHAGFNFHINNPFNDKKSMLWIRDWYQSIDYNWLKSKIIVHGHTPTTKNQIQKMFENINNIQVLVIDSGCVMKEQSGYGNLCCLELNSMNFIFQKNID